MTSYNYIFLTLAFFCLQLPGLSAQEPGNDGRPVGTLPGNQPTQEKAPQKQDKLKTYSEYYKEMGVPMDVDVPGDWLDQQNELAANRTTAATADQSEEMAKRLKKLEAQWLRLQLLNEQLQADNAELRRSIYACCSGSSDLQPALYQNVPNPSNEQTSIAYFLPQQVKSARLVIKTIDGKELSSYALDQRGEGKMELDTALLQAGTYIYFLYADQAIVDSKIMILH